MWEAILKIIVYILDFLGARQKSPVTRDNQYNIELQKEKEKHLRHIEQAHKTRDLDAIRKDAAE